MKFAKAVRTTVLTASLLSTPPICASSLPDCHRTLELAGEYAQLISSFSKQGVGALADSEVAAKLHQALGTPDWMEGFHQSLTPHAESIRFAGSHAMAQVAALQLQDLGVKSAKKAAEFFTTFAKLPAERQLAFVNGMVFRLLWETRNRLAEEANRKRLGMNPDDFLRLQGMLNNPTPERMRALALFLMCYLDVRGEAFGAQIELLWDHNNKYTAPISTDRRRWAALHGVMLHPLSGNHLYRDADFLSLTHAMSELEAVDALDFFVGTEFSELGSGLLLSLELSPNIDERVKQTIASLRHQGSSQQGNRPGRRARLHRETQAELLAVEARLQMLELGLKLEALGPQSEATEMVSTLVGTLVPNTAHSVSTWVADQISGGVSSALSYTGLQNWQAFVVVQLFARLSGFWSPAVEALTPHSLLHMQDQAGTIIAFAQALRGDDSNATALRARRDALRARLESLL